jgi:hypothetical protein
VLVMSRTTLELLERQLEASYRTGGGHSLLGNLASVRPEEWDVRPLNPDVGDDSEFGNDPHLSICDLVAHLGAAKRMYANHAFGDGSLRWGAALLPGSRDMKTMMAWLDDAHQTFMAGVASLEDDSELRVERGAHWGGTLATNLIIWVMMSHDLYHAGEINRQRGLVRGSDGWERVARQEQRR